MTMIYLVLNRILTQFLNDYGILKANDCDILISIQFFQHSKFSIFQELSLTSTYSRKPKIRHKILEQLDIPKNEF